jgi:PAS domain S-box-containing protein
MRATVRAAARRLPMARTTRRGSGFGAAVSLLLLASPATTQVLNFRHLTGVDGIPQSQIVAIHQDARHYLWIGTYGRLSRYNGAEFRTYATTRGLASNTVTSIAEDADGRILVGAIGGGVCILDEPGIRCIREADGLPHDDVLDILLDEDGRSLWVATQGGAARITGDLVRTYGEEVGLRTRRLDAERRRLGRLVAERTRELSRKNEELEREVADRERAEQELLSSRQRMQEVIETSTNLFYSHTPDGLLTYVSPQCRRLLGCEPEQALRSFSEFVTSNPANKIGLAATERAIATGEKQPPYIFELRGLDGRKRWVEVNESPVVREGRVHAIVGSLTDVTEAKMASAEQDRLEAQLRQAQKMEAVGRLAGGIAHDFNNLLTADVGNTELVAAGLETDHPLQHELAPVKGAADRAAALVAQLLAFSRQQLIRRRVLDLINEGSAGSPLHAGRTDRRGTEAVLPARAGAARSRAHRLPCRRAERERLSGARRRLSAAPGGRVRRGRCALAER